MPQDGGHNPHVVQRRESDKGSAKTAKTTLNSHKKKREEGIAYLDCTYAYMRTSPPGQDTKKNKKKRDAKLAPRLKN